MESNSLSARTGSSEEYLSFEAMQSWVAFEQRFISVSKEWEAAIDAGERSSWSEMLRYAQQALTIIDGTAFEDEIALSATVRDKVNSIRCLKFKALQELGDKDRAISILEELIHNSQGGMIPRNPAFLAYLLEMAGKIYMRIGDSIEAEKKFTHLLQIKGDSLEAHKGLGSSLDLRLLRIWNPDYIVVSNAPEQVSRDQQSDLTDALSSRILDHFLRAIRLGCVDRHVMVRVGTLLAEREEWDAAARHLTRAVKLWPESSQVHLQLGRVLRTRGQILRQYGIVQDDAREADRLVGLAISHYQQATWIDLNGVEARLELGELLLGENRSVEAMHIVSQANDLDSEHIWGRVLMGEITNRLGRPKETIENLVHALKLAERNAMDDEKTLHLQTLLGDAYLKQENLNMALSTYQTCLQLILKQGGDNQDTLALVYANLGIVKSKQNDLQGAKEAFAAALELGDVGIAHAGLGNVILHESKTDQLVTDGLTHLRLGLDFGCRDSEVILTGLNLLPDVLSRDNIQLEKRILQAAVGIWPSSWEFNFLLGKILLDEEHPTDSPMAMDAVFLVRRSTSLNPQCLECFVLLGKLYQRQRRNHLALESLTQAFNIDKMNPMTHLMLGSTLARIGRHDQSLRAFQDSIKFASTEPALAHVATQARVNSAAVLLQKKEITKALELLFKAVADEPENVEALHTLSLVLLANGQSSLANRYSAKVELIQGTSTNKLPQSVEESWSSIFTSAFRRLGNPFVTVDTKLPTAKVTTPQKTLSTDRVVEDIFLGKKRKQNETKAKTRGASNTCKNSNMATDTGLLIQDAGSLFQLAGMFAAQGELDKAMDCFGHVAESSNDLLAPVAQFELGMLMKSIDQEEALSLLTSASNTLPVEHESHLKSLLWAAVLVSRTHGDSGHRLALLSNAARSHPNSFHAFHALGVELEERGDINRAQDAFMEASFNLETNSSFSAADTFYRIANLKAKLNLPKSLDYLERAVDFTKTQQHQVEVEVDSLVAFKFPNVQMLHIAVLTDLGTAYREMGQAQKASDVLVDALHRVRQVDGHAMKRFAAQCLQELGKIFSKDKQQSLALLFFRGALRILPTEEPEIIPALIATTFKCGQPYEHALLSEKRALRNLHDEEVVLDAAHNLERVGLIEKAVELIRAFLVGRKQSADGLQVKKYLVELMTSKAKLDEAKRYVREDGMFALALERVEHLSIGMKSMLVEEWFLNEHQEPSSDTRLVWASASDLLRKLQSPRLALEMGRHMLHSNADDLEAAANVFGIGLGSEFSALNRSTIAASRESTLHANMLIIPHIVGVIEGNVVVSDELRELHSELAVIRMKQGEIILALIHVWWYLASESPTSLPAEKVFSFDIHASRLSLELSLSTSDTMLASHMRQLALSHAQTAEETLIKNQWNDNQDQMRCGVGSLWYILGNHEKSLKVYNSIKSNSCLCKDAGLGLVFSSIGDKKEALKHFEQVHTQYPNKRSKDVKSKTVRRAVPENFLRSCSVLNGDAMLRYGKLLSEVGKSQEAITVLRLASEDVELSHQKHVDALFHLGSTNFHIGKYRQAIDSLLDVLALVPGHLSARNNIGAALYRLGDLSTAVKHLNNVLVRCNAIHARDTGDEINECKLTARMNLALAYEDLGEFDAAVVHARAVLLSANKDPRVDKTSVLRQIARALGTQGKFDEAVVTLRSAVKSLQLELQYVQTSEKVVSRSNVVARSESRVRHEIADTLQDLGLVLTRAGEFDEAVRILRNVLLMRCNEKFNQNEDKEQLVSSTLWDVLDSLPVRAIEKQLKSPGPLTDLGNAYFQARNFEQAKRVYELSDRLFPDRTNTLNNLGVVAFHQDNLELATSYLTRALEIDPTNEHARVALNQISSNGKVVDYLRIMPSSIGHPPGTTLPIV